MDISIEQALKLGVEAHRKGSLKEAERLYHVILKFQPKQADANHNLGLIALSRNQLSEALALFKIATEGGPKVEQFWLSYIGALISSNQFKEAKRAAKKAKKKGVSEKRVEALFDKRFAKPTVTNPVRQGPSEEQLNTLMEHYQNRQYENAENLAKLLTQKFPKHQFSWKVLGALLKQTGRNNEAISAMKKSVKIEPQDAEARNNLGVIFQELGRLDEAKISYIQTIAIEPNFAEAYNNLGALLLELGKLDEAKVKLSKAISLDINSARAYNNLGATFTKLWRLIEAEANYKRALTLKPDYADAYNNLGNTLKELGRLDEAEANLRRAIDLEPNYVEANYNLGHVLAETGRLDEAAVSYKHALSCDPNHRSAEIRLVHVQKHMCDWSHPEEFFSSLDALTNVPVVSTFNLLSMIDSPSQHQKFSRKWAESEYSSIQVLPLTKPSSKKRLRVGYFSSDMHDHAILFLMAGLLREHDKSKFDIHVYSYGRVQKGEWRRRAQKDVTSFIDVSDMSDSDIVALAREHELDIAIDVNGYTKNTRSRLFAYRMAPIQINYLGYPSTMGADFIDYLIGDNIIIPDEQREFYSEKIIYMPHCYQPNDEARSIAETVTSRSDFSLPEDGFVFCCFNNNFKISPKEYNIWMRIMKQVDNSVLWLLGANQWAEQNLKREAEARSISSERIVFAHKVPLAEHLARHKHADLFIDTFNYNAHTTASDALWAGLPVVTKQGKQFSARVAASLLHAAGLGALVTKTESEYENLIVSLAKDRAGLASIKQTLLQTRKSCPLFDTVSYTRQFEAGLQKAYQYHRNGTAPADIYIEDAKPNK